MSPIAPSVPRPLLEYLQKVFPNKLPEYLGPPETVAYLIGNQQVIKHLAALYERQSNAVLGPTF